MEEKVDSLIGESPEIGEALEFLVEEADAAETAVTWDDVEDDMTSGTWGRLIQTGVLEEADDQDGLLLADSEAVEEVIAGGTPTEPIEATPWKLRDKVVAVGGILFMMSYTVGPTREVVGGTMNDALAPLTEMYDFFMVVALLAVATSVVSITVRQLMVDEEVTSQLKSRLEDLRERAKSDGDDGIDEEEFNSIDDLPEEQRELMGVQKKMMLEQIRPMMWILMVTLPVFLWLYWVSGTGDLSEAESVMVVPLFSTIDLTASLIGPIKVWVGWYVVVSIASSYPIRKVAELVL